MYTRALVTALAALLCCGPVWADDEPMRAEPVKVEDGGKTYVGTLIWNGTTPDERPGVLMIPNWMGPTPESAEKARKIAAMGYVVLMWDVYGELVRPTNPKEAGAAAASLAAVVEARFG